MRPRGVGGDKSVTSSDEGCKERGDKWNKAAGSNIFDRSVEMNCSIASTRIDSRVLEDPVHCLSLHWRGQSSELPKFSLPNRSLQWKIDQVQMRVSKIDQVKAFIWKNDQLLFWYIAVNRFFLTHSITWLIFETRPLIDRYFMGKIVIRSTHP